MKKVWVQPKAVVEGFEANEYVAACAAVTRCEIPYMDNNHQNPAGSVHTANRCGVNAGHTIELDANGKFVSMRQLNPGDSDGSCKAYSDAGYSESLVGEKLGPGQIIYWISNSKSVNGKIYKHMGNVSFTNHS